MARTVKDQTARQGGKGRPVLMVLIGGLFGHLSDRDADVVRLNLSG
jgi:hypothetical protein